jgi:hypothetical protein
MWSHHVILLSKITLRYFTCPQDCWSYIMTDHQSANLPWNKAPIWGLWPDFYYCQTFTILSMWGALSDERTGLTFARVTVSSNKYVVSMYNLHFTCHKMYVYITYTRPLSVQTQYSRSCPILSSSCYNGSLVTWMVICLTTTKLKARIFPVSGFTLSNVENICIFIILYVYDFCLMLA